MEISIYVINSPEKKINLNRLVDGFSFDIFFLQYQFSNPSKVYLYSSQS